MQEQRYHLNIQGTNKALYFWRRYAARQTSFNRMIYNKHLEQERGSRLHTIWPGRLTAPFKSAEAS